MKIKKKLLLFCLIHLRVEVGAEDTTFLCNSVDFHAQFPAGESVGVGGRGHGGWGLRVRSKGREEGHREAVSPTLSLDSSCEMYLRVPCCPLLPPSVNPLYLWTPAWCVFTTLSHGRNNRLGAGWTRVSVRVLWL